MAGGRDKNTECKARPPCGRSLLPAKILEDKAEADEYDKAYGRLPPQDNLGRRLPMHAVVGGRP